jgi:hypothetical protein
VAIARINSQKTTNSSFGEEILDPALLASATSALAALASKVSEGVASKAGEDLWKEAKKLLHWETQEPKLSDLPASIQSQLQIDEDLARKIISLLKSAPVQMADHSQNKTVAGQIVHANNYTVINYPLPTSSPVSVLADLADAQPEQLDHKTQVNRGGTRGVSRSQLIKTIAWLIFLMACIYPLPEVLLDRRPESELPDATLLKERSLFIHNQILLLIFDAAVLGALLFASRKWRSPGSLPIAAWKLRAFSLWLVGIYALIIRQLQFGGEVTRRMLDNAALSMAWPLWFGGICLLISAATLVFSLLGAGREHNP